MKQSFGRIISILYRKSQVYMGTALKKYNLTAAEQPFFAYLNNHNGTTQEELSTHLCIDKAATARTIKSLEDKGFVKRITDTNDRRQNRVFLTDKARECWDGVSKELYKWNETLLKGIDDDTALIVFDALETMEKNVKEKLNI